MSNTKHIKHIDLNLSFPSEFNNVSDGFLYSIHNIINVSYNSCLNHFKQKQSYPTIDIEITPRNDLSSTLSKIYQNNRYIRLFQLIVRIKGIEFENSSICWNAINKKTLQWSALSKSHGKIISLSYYNNSNSVKQIALICDKNTNKIKEISQLLLLNNNINNKLINKLT
eukprot:329334_1